MKKTIIVFSIVMMICCMFSSCWLLIPYTAISESKRAKEEKQEQALIAAQKEENRKKQEALMAEQKRVEEENRQKRIQEKEEEDKRIRQSYKSIASERGYASFDELVAKNSVSYDKFARAIETKTLSSLTFKKGDIILVPASKAIVLEEEDMLLTLDTRALSRYTGEINSRTIGIYEATDMFFLEADKKIRIATLSILNLGSTITSTLEKSIGDAFYMEYIGNRNTGGTGRRAAVRPVFKYIEVAIDNMED